MSRVAIVTGSRKGLGRFIAGRLLEDGWIVAGCSRERADWQHDRYHHYDLDVAEERQVIGMVRDVTARFSRIDALVNNAGRAAMNHLLLTPMASARSVFDANWFGTFLFTREVGKAMSRQKSGRIVNMSTVAVALDLEGEAAYAASKAAVESLTRTSARELAPFGITVNAVGPTPVATDLTRTIPKARIDVLVKRQPIAREGTPEDVWNVVEFFLREESTFVTGQVLYLGGIRS